MTVDSLLTVGGSLAGVELTAAIREAEASVEAGVATAAFEGVTMDRLRANVHVAGQTMRGDFLSPRVVAHDVPLSQVKGKISLGEDRRLHFDQVTAGVWTGRVEGGAIIDLTDPADPGFEIQTKALQLQANDFLTALTPGQQLPLRNHRHHELVLGTWSDAGGGGGLLDRTR